MERTNDRAVRAFRKYIRICGTEGDKLPYISLCKRLVGSCRTEAEAVSLLAVHDTFTYLEAKGKSDCADAVRYVYFSERGRTPRKNEISFRVRRFAVMRSMDDRTVWRRLEEAKSLYLNVCAIRMRGIDR